jgi:hypothetical protein
LRLILGILKGGIIGGGLGYGFYALGLGGLFSWLLYPLIGVLVGFIAGRPFWAHDTIWTPVVKAVVGAVVGVGLYALAAKALGDPELGFIQEGATLTSLPYVLGGVVGVLYGVFVEIDDGGKADKEAAQKQS